MDTLYTFLDNITHYRTESVHFLGLMNSATEGFNVEGSFCMGWQGFCRVS